MKKGGRIGSGIRLALAGGAAKISGVPTRNRSVKKRSLRAEECTIKAQCVDNEGRPVFGIVGRLEIEAIPVEMP